MIRYFNQLVSISAAIVAVAVLSTVATPAYAQRDAGAKARSDFGTGFRSPTYQSRSYSSSPVEARRSFSYEPAKVVGGCHCGTSQAIPAERAAAQPQVEHRSFSYEPAQPSNRSYSSPKKALWQYPKTDPRRYQP